MNTTTNIFGYRFICDKDYVNLADDVVNDVDLNKMGITNFITPNANFINVYGEYPNLNSFCKDSSYILPDGQPIVWLSKLTKNKIKKRLTGSDFFPIMFKKIKDKRHKCLFIVSNENLRDRFLKEKPGASYIIPAFFEMNDSKTIDYIGNLMVETILSKQINYVFIGISDPKQGVLAQNVTAKLKKLNHNKSCIFFFLGASFEFYFGLKKRAPAFFRKFGLEWFYRLIKEPKRMYKRYIFGNFIFILHSFKWLLNRKAYI